MDFLNGCLQFDPVKRFSYEDLLKHPFVAEVNNEFVPENERCLAEKILLSYHGGRAGAEGGYKVDESAMLNLDPHAHMDAKNAITMNIKDSTLYHNIYEEGVKNYFLRLEA